MFPKSPCEASALSRQRPRTVLNAGFMHSIVYVVILTRKGLEGFDCSKMTAVDSRDFPVMAMGGSCFPMYYCRCKAITHARPND